MTENKKITWSMARLRDAASAARGNRAPTESRREPGFGEASVDHTEQRGRTEQHGRKEQREQREPDFGDARFGASRDAQQRRAAPDSAEHVSAAAADRLAQPAAAPGAARVAFQGAPVLHTVILLVGVPAIVLVTTLASLMIAPSRADISPPPDATEASSGGAVLSEFGLPLGAMEAEAERSAERGLAVFPPAFSGLAAPTPKASGSFLFLGLRDASPARALHQNPLRPRIKVTPARLEIPLEPGDHARADAADAADAEGAQVAAPDVDAHAPNRPRAPLGDPLRGAPAFTSLENGFDAAFGAIAAPGVFGDATTHGRGAGAPVKDAASALERAPDEQPQAPSMSEPPSARLLAATQKDIGSLESIDRTPDKAPPPEKKRATAPPKFDGRSAEQILKAALSAEASEVGVLQEDFGAAMEASLAAALRPDAASELAAAPREDDTGRIDQSPDQPPAGEAEVASLEAPSTDAEPEAEAPPVGWAPEQALRPNLRPARRAAVVTADVAAPEVATPEVAAPEIDVEESADADAAVNAEPVDAAFTAPDPSAPTAVAPEAALRPRLRP